jgi:F0F1-type ATP synthase assembly protein I
MIDYRLIFEGIAILAFIGIICAITNLERKVAKLEERMLMVENDSKRNDQQQTI